MFAGFWSVHPSFNISTPPFVMMKPNLFCLASKIGTEVVITTHCFKNLFREVKITVHTETVDGLLFFRCEKAPFRILVFVTCRMIWPNSQFLVIFYVCLEVSRNRCQIPISCAVLLAYIDILKMGKAVLHQFQRSIYIYLMIFRWTSHHLQLFGWTQSKVHQSCLLVFFSSNLYQFRKMINIYKM